MQKKPTRKTDHVESQQWPYEALKRFRLIFRAVQQHSQWVESQCGVTSAQLWAMWELSRQPGLMVTELAKTMSIHHSMASNLLDKLERKNLIVRQRISQDQRVVTLSLTPEGLELMDRAPPPPQGILQHALFGLQEDMLKSLTKHLDVLVWQMHIRDENAAMEPLNPLPERAEKKTDQPTNQN